MHKIENPEWLGAADLRRNGKHTQAVEASIVSH